ncbi:MAG: hypothetical protein AB7S75_10925 [Desulfococcaceae bacterium]
MSQNTEIIKKYLIDNLSKLQIDGGIGQHPRLPSFDLYSLDYLLYAEDELNLYLSNKRKRHIINCVSHLKRAVDCQIDTFLYSYGLYDLFKKRNLGIDKKLEFLNEIGVFSSRTLSRFNTIRNNLEHKFEIPNISDIEMYFDLVSSSVSILESAILYSSYSEQTFVTEHEYGHHDRVCFYVKYDFNDLKIRIGWDRVNGSEEFVASIKEIKEYAYFFKIFILLNRRETLASDRYILTKL